VSVLLCDDEEMRRLNHAFRSVNGPTDVLSFRQDDVALTPEGRALLGDVVISHQAVKRQAREQGHDEETEAVLLALHGALHLLGHEDETRRGSAEMRRKAEETARSLGYEVRKAVNRV
jgi:probable rRNA maturation factor